MRRYHVRSWDPPDCSTLSKRGVRAVTLHHGSASPSPRALASILFVASANPYINYPFHAATQAKLRAYTSACAEVNVAVSIYYTHREVSMHADELGALLGR
jgi:hypothetical protein